MKNCPRCKAEYPDYAVVCPLDGIGLVFPQNKSIADPLLNSTLDNRYRIISKIGEGGMGTVYLAEHITLQRNLAVKVLRREFAEDEEAIRRFTNEARVASKIGHDNIVEISDFGKTPNGSFYFAMEYLPGNSLADLISKFGQLPIQRCLHISKQIARALSAAHKNGVVHRDLKPENIFLLNKEDKKDFVKILDFGIAKMRSMKIEKLDRQTASGVIMGTPAFMSPEQASGKDVDARTDMYSLGILLYEMLTGKLPFDSESVIKTLVMHQTEAPVPLSKLRPEINPGLEEIVLRCLEKKPENRFYDMDALLEAMRMVESNQPPPPKPVSQAPVQYEDPNAIYLPQDQHPETDMGAARSALFVDPSQVWYDNFEKPAKEPAEAKEPPKASSSEQQQDKPAQFTSTRPSKTGDEFDDSHFGPMGEEPALELHEHPRVPTSNVSKPAFREDQFSGRRQTEPGPVNKSSPMLWLIFLGLLIGAGIFYGVQRYLLPPGIDGQGRTANTAGQDQAAGKQPPQPSQTVRKASPPEPSGLDPATLSKFNRAVSDLSGGLGEKAAAGFWAVLQKYPDFPNAYLGLGDAFMKQGKKDPAIKQYEAYLEYGPTGPGATRAKAVINQYYGR
jgi:serine/threonine protein kinase